MLHAFTEAIQGYAELRAYLADCHGEPEPDIISWLRSKRAVYVDPQGVPKAKEWEDAFYEGFWAVSNFLTDYDAESDEIAAVVYEEGLLNDEPWAVEAHERRIADDV